MPSHYSGKHLQASSSPRSTGQPTRRASVSPIAPQTLAGFLPEATGRLPASTASPVFMSLRGGQRSFRNKSLFCSRPSPAPSQENPGAGPARLPPPPSTSADAPPSLCLPTHIIRRRFLPGVFASPSAWVSFLSPEGRGAELRKAALSPGLNHGTASPHPMLLPAPSHACSPNALRFSPLLFQPIMFSLSHRNGSSKWTGIVCLLFITVSPAPKAGLALAGAL